MAVDFDPAFPVLPQFDEAFQDYKRLDHINMICFDGGGMKGYTSLKILQRLMCFVEEEENLVEWPAGNEPVHPIRPALYFDFLYGTSTGGLIAILLGRLRMTVDGALIEYRNLGDKIFHPSRKQSRFNPISRLTKWDARGLESAVEDLVRRLYPQPPGFNQDIPTGRNIFSQLPSPNDLCKVGVMSYKEGLYGVVKKCIRLMRSSSTVEAFSAGPRVFRTFHALVNRDIPGASVYQPLPDAVRCGEASILEASRATTAAPTYFRAAQVEAVAETFIDGGVGANNPTYHAWREVVSQICQPENTVPDASKLLVVSVGAGYEVPAPARWSWSPFQWMPSPVKKLTATEETHQCMKAKYNNTQMYYRLNVTGGRDTTAGKLAAIELDAIRTGDMSTTDFIDQQMEIFFNEPAGLSLQRKMKALARVLVKNRRERASTRGPASRHKERFSRCTLYRCFKTSCIGSWGQGTAYSNFKHAFLTKEAMMEHLITDHGAGDEQMVISCRVPPKQEWGPW